MDTNVALCLQLKAQVAARLKVLEELQLNVNDKQRQSADAKTAIAETKARLAKVKEEKAKVTGESNRLSELIVQSPERMKADTDRMHAQLAQV